MGKQKESLDEFKQALTIEKIDPLTERVNKCYSKEDYEDFQAAVEKIAARYLKQVAGWAVFIWLITMVGGMLAQKFLAVF